MEQQLLTYIEQEIKRGVAEPMIKKALREAGWGDSLIEEAFALLQAPVPPASESVSSELEAPAREETISEGEDDAVIVGKKKLNKPLVIVASVFGAMILIVTALVSYFSFSTPSQVAEEPAAPAEEPAQAENPSVKVVVEEPAAPEEEDRVNLIPAAATTTVAATSTVATTTVAATSTVATSTAAVPDLSTSAGRDEQRKLDMRKLVDAQKIWHQTTAKYYTCGLKAGDCGGRKYGYPEQIGKSLPIAPLDPLAAQYLSKALVCGKDYVYCGLNNSSYSQFFCYYAKLEGGDFYTASHNGNFQRKTAPKIFEECGAAN
ncbi:MAG: hypothetical protein WBC48_03345 [Minisyncoccales bacterium]